MRAFRVKPLRWTFSVFPTLACAFVISTSLLLIYRSPGTTCLPSLDTDHRDGTGQTEGRSLSQLPRWFSKLFGVASQDNVLEDPLPRAVTPPPLLRKEELNPDLFPIEGFEKPYAQIVRDTWQRRKYPERMFGCLYGADPNHLQCQQHCLDGNCASTVDAMSKDMVFSKRKESESWAKDPPVFVYLTPTEIEKFFTSKTKAHGLLKVDEYCRISNYEGSGLVPEALVWRHVYAIERYGPTCYLIQGDQDKYQMQHFLGGKKFPEQFSGQDDEFPGQAAVEKLQSDFGYFQSGIAPGKPCADVLEMYRTAYPELSAMKEYQLTCLSYLLWKNSLPNSTETSMKSSVTSMKRSMIRSQLRNWIDLVEKEDFAILRLFRYMSMLKLGTCNDPEFVMRAWFPTEEEFRPVSANTAYLWPGMSLDPTYSSTDVKDDRGVSMSRGTEKCKAIASALSQDTPMDFSEQSIYRQFF